VDHLCYIKSLKDALPSKCDEVLSVFYHFETTQNTSYMDEAKLHVPNTVCVQQFCSRCEDVEDGGDCVRCGKWKPSFWEDPIGDLLSYLYDPRPWGNKIVAIAHNAKAFDLHFVSEQGDPTKMETGTYHERTGDNMHEDCPTALSG